MNMGFQRNSTHKTYVFNKKIVSDTQEKNDEK